MKKLLTLLFIFAFLVQGHSFAQYPQNISFKNDPRLSDSNGILKDPADNYFLYELQEPTIANYYLNKEVYRFALKADLINAYYVVKLEKKGDSISITTKELCGKQYEYILLTNSSKSVDKHDYNTFLQLVDTLFAHPMAEDRLGCDGSDWTFEMSTEKGYFYEKKWSPRKGDQIKAIGDLMIDLSEFKHKRSLKKL